MIDPARPIIVNPLTMIICDTMCHGLVGRNTFQAEVTVGLVHRADGGSILTKF